MTSFNAQTAVDTMDYDLRPYVDKFGIVPEPSTDQMEAYYNGAKALAADAKGLRDKVQGLRQQSEAGEMSVDEMESILSSMDDFSMGKYQKQMAQLVGDLCSQEPSTDDLMKLPYRVLTAFFGWMQGNLRPEAGARVTNV